MGAYSMDGLISAELEETILGAIVRPTLRGLEAEGLPYRGFLYFGLMLTVDGPKVLEFNCRMGDPETQAILVRANFDLGSTCLLAAQGSLEEARLNWRPGASACVVIASGGYPGSFEAGKRIAGLAAGASKEGAVVFHSGTRSDGDHYYTSGGRVLGVSAAAKDLKSALNLCYDVCSTIRFEAAHFRKDIGHRALTKAARGAN
jgi:phosphoribosylamine--glycine ligase